MAKLFANSGDPDQTLLRVSRLQWVNCHVSDLPVCGCIGEDVYSTQQLFITLLLGSKEKKAC